MRILMAAIPCPACGAEDASTEHFRESPQCGAVIRTLNARLCVSQRQHNAAGPGRGREFYDGGTKTRRKRQLRFDA
jgi:hypothetical protein